MLRWADACLDEPMLSNMQHEFFQNAFLESFCIHARALINFFDKDAGDDEIAAREVCASFDAGPSLCADPIYLRLLGQIGHLTRRRADAEKLSASDRLWLRQAIERKHAAFVAALPVELACLVPAPTANSGCDGGGSQAVV